eukprot:gene21921-24856_t
MSIETIEHAVINLLTVNGFLKDSDLLDQLESVKEDFSVGQINLPTIFRSINGNLRKYAMEIKSIHLTNSNNDRITYHGLVNTEEDFVSKEYGAPFDPVELKYFTQIAGKLLEDNYLSTGDILDLRNADKIKKDQAQSFIAKLETLGYLRRNDANYLILGVRAHLELRSYLESVIMNAVDVDALEETQREERMAHLRTVIDELPQIIVY